MGEFIQRPDGTFAGSIGAGKDRVPTAAPRLPVVSQSGDSTAVDDTVSTIADLHARMVAVQQARHPRKPCTHPQFSFIHPYFVDGCARCEAYDAGCDTKKCQSCERVW